MVFIQLCGFLAMYFLLPVDLRFVCTLGFAAVALQTIALDERWRQG